MNEHAGEGSDDMVASADAERLASLEARLDELERESDERRSELMRLASDVPAALSRRAMFSSMAADLRSAPNKSEIASRAGRKIGRLPSALSKRLRTLGDR